MKQIFIVFALLLCCVPCGAQQEIYSGVSDQYVYFKMVDATDHVTAETGLSSFTIERSRNGATGTAWTTPTVVEVDATNAPGVYALLFDEDTTLTSGDISQNMVLGIAATGCAPTALSVILKRPVVTAGETLTVSSGALPWSAAWDAEVQSECVDAIASLFQLAGGIVEANVVQVSGDPNAANNAELFFDGTGYAGGSTKLSVNTVDIAAGAITVSEAPNLDAAVSAVKTKTDFLPSATAGTTSGLPLKSDLSGITATADARDLLPVDHTWEMRRSNTTTGTAWRSTNKRVVYPGDVVRLGWNCDVPGLLPGGSVIATQGDPELVTASDDITITDPSIGHDAKNAKVEITVAADAVPGTHWIKTAITPSGASGPKTVYGEIEVVEEPE